MPLSRSTLIPPGLRYLSRQNLATQERSRGPFPVLAGEIREGLYRISMEPVLFELHNSPMVSADSWSRKAYARHGLSLLTRRDLAYSLSENDVDSYGSGLARRSLMIRYSMMHWLPIMQNRS